MATWARVRQSPSSGIKGEGWSLGNVDSSPLAQRCAGAEFKPGTYSENACVVHCDGNTRGVRAWCVYSVGPRPWKSLSKVQMRSCVALQDYDHLVFSGSTLGPAAWDLSFCRHDGKYDIPGWQGASRALQVVFYTEHGPTLIHNQGFHPVVNTA